MYIVERLWVDTLGRFGWSPVGVVSTKEEAERVADLEWIPRSLSPWPLDYVDSPKKDSVPRFRVKETNNLDRLTLTDICKIEIKNL